MPEIDYRHQKIALAATRTLADHRGEAVFDYDGDKKSFKKLEDKGRSGTGTHTVYSLLLAELPTLQEEHDINLHEATRPDSGYIEKSRLGDILVDLLSSKHVIKFSEKDNVSRTFSNKFRSNLAKKPEQLWEELGVPQEEAAHQPSLLDETEEEPATTSELSFDEKKVRRILNENATLDAPIKVNAAIAEITKRLQEGESDPKTIAKAAQQKMEPYIQESGREPLLRDLIHHLTHHT